MDSLSVKVLDSPGASVPSNSSRPLWSFAEIQLALVGRQDDRDEVLGRGGDGTVRGLRLGRLRGLRGLCGRFAGRLLGCGLRGGGTFRHRPLVLRVAAAEGGEAHEADHGDDGGDHGRGPVGPLPLGTDPLGFEHRRGGRGCRPAAVSGVVRLDQGFRIDADGAGERTDVTAGVDVAAAPREIVSFDRVHDRDAHTGGGTDLVDSEPGGDPGLLQDRPDGRSFDCGFDDAVLGPVVGRRPLIFGGVGFADGHEGAFRACSHLLEVQSRG